MNLKPDFTIIRSLFRFGLPTGVQGIAMNVGGVLLLRFIGSLEHSAAAQAAYAVGYTELFSLITWTSVGLMGASATIAGQNLGAGNPDRAVEGVRVASRIGLGVAAGDRRAVPADPRLPAGGVRHDRPDRAGARPAAAALSERLGPVHHRGAELHRRPAGHGRHRSPLYISIVSQVVVPLGLCAILQATRGLQPSDIWTRHRPRPHDALRAQLRCGSGSRSGGTSGWTSSRRGRS